MAEPFIRCTPFDERNISSKSKHNQVDLRNFQSYFLLCRLCGQASLLVWKLLCKCLRDCRACSYPDPFLLADIVDEVLESLEATWSADDPAMKSNGHHLGRTFLAFFVEHIESVLQVFEECTCGSESTSSQELEIVTVVGVWSVICQSLFGK